MFRSSFAMPLGISVVAALLVGPAEAAGRPYEVAVTGVPAGCKSECPVLFYWSGAFGKGVSQAMADCRRLGYRCTVQV